MKRIDKRLINNLFYSKRVYLLRGLRTYQSFLVAQVGGTFFRSHGAFFNFIRTYFCKSKLRRAGHGVGGDRGSGSRGQSLRISPI